MGRAKYFLKQLDIDVGMKSTATLPTLLLAFLLFALLMESAHAYENHQYGFSITPPEGWALEEDTEQKLPIPSTFPILPQTKYHPGDSFTTVYIRNIQAPPSSAKPPIVTILSPTNNSAIASDNVTLNFYLTAIPSTSFNPDSYLAYYTTSWDSHNISLSADSSSMSITFTEIPDGKQWIKVHATALSGENETNRENVTKPNTPDSIIIGKFLYIYSDAIGISDSSLVNFTIDDSAQIAPSASFMFRDPSNYTGATIIVVVNQSGLPQDDPFLASRTHGYLIRYLAETYPGYLITERGAKAVYNLNGYEIKFNATVDGKEMRFDSVIFVETNQTFYIVCGAYSPAYDNLSSAFDESISSFRLAPFTQSSTIYAPQDNAMWVWIGTIAVIAVSVAPSIVYFFRRKQNQKLHLANKNTKCGESSN